MAQKEIIDLRTPIMVAAFLREDFQMKDSIIINMDSIISISNTLLKYKDNESAEHKIDLKESASIWWEKYNEETLLTKILRKKQRNRYVGNKAFSIGEMSYIELFTQNEQIRFVLEIPYTKEQSVLIPFRKKWDKINVALNNEGYWLFDMN